MLINLCYEPISMTYTREELLSIRKECQDAKLALCTFISIKSHKLLKTPSIVTRRGCKSGKRQKSLKSTECFTRKRNNSQPGCTGHRTVSPHLVGPHKIITISKAGCSASFTESGLE